VRERDAHGKFVYVPPPDLGVELDQKICLQCAQAEYERFENIPLERGKHESLATRIRQVDKFWERHYGRACMLRPTDNKRRKGEAPQGCKYELEYFMMEQKP
jgi:hypothetical protein